MNSQEGQQHGGMGAGSSKTGKKIREEKQRQTHLKEEQVGQEGKRGEARCLLRHAGDLNLQLAQFANIQKSLPGHESVFSILHHPNL